MKKSLGGWQERKNIICRLIRLDGVLSLDMEVTFEELQNFQKILQKTILLWNPGLIKRYQ
ncbi:MAG: hypothetical protein ACLRTI_11965 [Blautia sp.]